MIETCQPCYSKESEQIKDDISRYISGYNCFVAIQNAFNRNPIALNYLSDAENEVLESGNASISSMYAIAIDSLAREMENYENKEDTNIDKLYHRISQLERENRILKSQLESIKKIIKEER